MRAAVAAVAGSGAFLINACCAAVGAHVHAGLLLVLGRLRIGAGRRFRIGWARSRGLGGGAGGCAIACVVARVAAVVIGEVGSCGVGPVWFVSGVPNLIIPVNARETIDSPCFGGGFYARGSIRLVLRRRGGGLPCPRYRRRPRWTAARQFVGALPVVEQALGLGAVVAGELDDALDGAPRVPRVGRGSRRRRAVRRATALMLSGSPASAACRLQWAAYAEKPG